MSALDKFYDFTLNLPDAKLTSKAMSLCNIDRNVFNIYLTLQEGKNNPILNADLGNYTVTMIVVKPKTKEYVEKVGVVDGSNDRLLFELGDTFNDQIGSYKGEIKVQNGNEVITSSSFAYTVTQSLISGLNAEIEASPDVEILRQLINEVKAVVGMTPGDPDSLLTDYQKKNDNTLITTDKTIIGAINENSSQIKDIAKDVLLEDGKLYLKKSDGTKLGTGVALPLSGSGGSVAWESITGKPATFTPSSHNHSKSDITDFPTIPTKTSELNNDSGFLTSHQDITGKVDKVDGKGLSTNDLTTTLKQNYDNAYAHSQTSHAPSNAKPNVQSDWNENNVSSDAYIKNKPTIPSAYVLPTASSTVLGGVKVGAGLSISNGVLSATGGAGGSSINDTTASATTTYSGNKIESIKEGLSSQIEQKASQSDLEVERERINSFTTLSSGSTTGDAELIDGRIGADGVTYTNIGTAIRTQCGNLNNLLDIGYEVTSNNRIDDSKFVGQNFDTLIGHNGDSKTFALGTKLKSKSVKGYIEFEDGTYADPLNGFFWFLKSSTGEVSNVTLSTKGTLVIADAFDKYDQIGIGSWTTYDKKIKTFFVGAYADDYDNYNEVLTSKVIDDIKISTPDNWYRDKKICAYGDSVVEQEKWQPYVASYLKCSFYNRGVGGTTVTQVNSSTNHMSSDTRINSIPTDSDVILIFAGHNDWSYAAINMGDLKTDALSESTSFKSAYALMIKKIQSRCPNAKIITMTLVGGRTTSETVNEDKQYYIRELCMTDFSKAIKEVSGYYGIPCIDVNANCGISTLNHTTYIADLIHPNDAGGKLIANEVINGMKRFQPIDL